MAANSSAKKPAAKKVFDIAKPGAVPPPSTSKPVIVGHRPLVQDPMLNQLEASSKEEPAVTDVPSAPPVEVESINTAMVTETPVSEPTVAGKVLKPLSNKQKADIEAASAVPHDTASEATEPLTETEITEEAAADDLLTTAEATSETAGSDNAPETAETEDASLASEAKPKEASATTESAFAPVPSEQQLSPEELANQQEIEKSESRARIEELINRKAYYLPINQGHSGTGFWGAFFLGLLLGLAILAAIVYVLDAGVIDAGFEFPFDFIK